MPKNKKLDLKIVTILVLMLLMLTACNKVDIYTNLDEDQANTMLSTLLKRGITAEKKSLGKAGYSLAVDADQMVLAFEILRENSLPKENYQNLGSIFSGGSMIASAGEEKARMAYAISQELSDTYSRIDGVLTSRVHVVLAENDVVNNRETPASVAVFLRHTSDSPVVNLVPKIKELASNAVSGLKFDNVTVMLVPVRDSVTVPDKLEAKNNTIISSNGFNWILILEIIIAALIIDALVNLARFLLAKRKKKINLSEEK